MSSLSLKRIQIVHDFIAAYNRFDVAAMLVPLDPRIEFRNISDGQVTVSTHGIEEFERQALTGAKLFRSRSQRVQELSLNEDRVEVEIDYHAILAVDLPNGLKAGNALSLKGRSVYRFDGERIIALEDYS